jgi:diguanylate cyclase (GGDEF)-like protein/putative nucleotidyltransferase with HDIG domain
MPDALHRARTALVSAVDRLLEPEVTDATRWRAFGMLNCGAGALGLATLALGMDAATNVPLALVLSLMTVALGLGVLPFAPRLPRTWLVFALIGEIGLATLSVLASGEADGPYALFYVWIGVAAWFFLGARQAALITATCAVATAGVFLTIQGADRDAATWWVTINGTVAAVSLCAAVLYGRSQRLAARLGAAATHDELTGLLNRRGYRRRLDEELARARRYGTPLSIVLGDLDAFKALNDRFGHRRGDDALRAFAEICREHLRGIDFVSRVGGEEFAIVLPSTGEHGGILAAERVRRAVRAELRAPDGTPVTASFGVATFPEHGTAAEVLLDHADQAMYAAKALGRDRTVGYARDLPRREDIAAGREQAQAVLVLAETLDLRDTGTRAHSETVASLCRQVAEAYGLGAERVERIRLAGLLHDVGKIGVPDDVLRKPGALTPSEWAEMREHPELGARIVGSAGLEDIAQWVLAHHERPDGRGYPYGLHGDQIPLEARILAVADAFEAMTADRPYRPAQDPGYALGELEAGAGTQFDAGVVATFVSVLAPARAA